MGGSSLLSHVFAGVGAGYVDHYDPVGVLLEHLNTGSAHTAGYQDAGMCFDGAGDLYCMNFSAGSMSKFLRSGVTWGGLVFPWNTSLPSIHPESCCPMPDGTHILTGEVDGSCLLRKWTLSGSLVATWAPDLDGRGTDWIDIAADGRTVFYTSEGLSVKRFDIVSNTQLADVPAAFSDTAFALRVRPNVPGELLVAGGASGQVWRIRISDGYLMQTYTLPSPGSSNLFALNLDPDGTSFWTAYEDLDLAHLRTTIYRVDIATGTIITSFTVPVNTRLNGLAIYGEPR